MIAWAVVDWGDDVAPFHEIDELAGDGCEFYAVLSAKPDGRGEWSPPYRLLYVGLAYKQPVHERIKQDHQSYDLLCKYLSKHRRDHDLIVQLGELRAYSAQNVTLPFVEDIEALLIHVNQPQFNDKHKKSYRGRPLVVTNDGDHEPMGKYASSSQAAFTRWTREGGPSAMSEQLSDCDEDE